MKWKTAYITMLSFLFLINGCTLRPHLNHSDIFIQSNLSADLQRLFEDPQFYDSIWGVAVQSLKTSEFIYLKNEHINLIPASNLKLFTTATALVKLSPDYQINTPIYRTGTISNDGVLEGDLIIAGRGDPSISGRYYNGEMTHVFKTWADSLRRHGIKKIKGNIIGDDNYFDDEALGRGWAWDYETEWYAAQVSALSFNDNCIDLIVSPGDSCGAAAHIEIVPNVAYAEIDNQIKTVDGSIQENVSFSRERGTNKITLYGNINVISEKKRYWITVENPTSFFVESFKQILSANGIETSGEAYDIDDLSYTYPTDDSLIVLTHHSPALYRIVETINKNSQNLYAELILRILGAEYKGKGSARNGVQVVQEFITQIGINPANFNMVDGSGLSRLNLVSVNDVLTLLKYMFTHPYSDAFTSSMPVSGVDGTLKNRLNQETTRGKVRAKTGYLAQAVSLSGYIEDEQQNLYIFSMINNNYSTPTSLSQRLQELACERIIHFSTDNTGQ